MATMPGVDLDTVRVVAGASGTQRARCSRDVVQALSLPLGAPVRVRVWNDSARDGADGDGTREWSYIAALEPWDDRGGRCVEVDAYALEAPAAGTLTDSSTLDAPSTALTGVIERLDAKPVTCVRVRVSQSKSGVGSEALTRRVLCERLIRPGARIRAGESTMTIERLEPRVDDVNVTWRVTQNTVIEDVGCRAGDANSKTEAEERSAKAETRLAACQPALDALRQAIVWPLKYANEARKLGVKFPRGLLLHGPPGTGKTEAVRAVAEEAGVRVFSVSSGDVFGAYAGECEKRLRKVFENARKDASKGSASVILIDEIDAICPTRQDGKAHETRVVAQLLTLMDGAGDAHVGAVPVIATTSRPNAIDPALRRPGRFDREIEMSLPSSQERFDILKLHTKSLPLASDVNLQDIANDSKGYSGADIAALSREAAMCAIKRRGASSTDMLVTADDFQSARGRVSASVVRGVAIDLPPVTWDEIGGLDDVKKRLRQAVEWPLHHTDAFERLGLRPPKGILLHGPPGCAKTTLARAAATASGATVITLSAADVFSKYLGEGEKILRSTFTKARKSAPAVLLLDEIDGMCGSRGEGATDGAHDVATRLLSVFLTEMDGLENVPSSGGGVLVVATTNRPQSLDPALTRPGRLDLVLEIPPLNLQGRAEALRVHTKDVSLADDVDIQALAAACDGFSGAELRHVVKEAALRALREDMNAHQVKQQHFMDAIKPKST